MQFIKNLFKKEPLQAEQINFEMWAAVTPAGVVKRLFYALEDANNYIKNLGDAKK